MSYLPKEPDIKLLPVVGAPLLLMMIFFSISLFVFNTRDIQQALRSEKIQFSKWLEKNSGFLISEGYLNQTEGMRLRLKSAVNNEFRQDVWIWVCLEFHPNGSKFPGAMSVKECVPDSAEEQEASTSFSETLILGRDSVGEIVLRGKQKRWFNSIFSVRLIGSIFFSAILSLLGGFALVHRLRKRVLRPLFEHISRTSHERGQIELAKQLAHDIRSPLLALQTVSGQTDKLPEPIRILLRQSIERIREISQKILRPTVLEGQPKTLEPLLEVVEDVLSEKRINSLVRIQVILDGVASNLLDAFVFVDRIELQRVISNIFGNSHDSITKPEFGTVTVSLSASEKEVSLTVSDNGKGIPDHIKPRLFQRGYSYGKTGGSGLGLSHARGTIESFGGSIHLTSVLGEGTTVIINLPKQAPPAWFSSKIRVTNESTVVIVDDDPFIAPIWQETFRNAGTTPKEMVVLDSFQALENWMKTNTISQQYTRFFIDYEFKGSQFNGLDYIEKLGIASMSTLVTHRAHEETVRSRCLSLKVTMLGKTLVPYVTFSAE